MRTHPLPRGGTDLMGCVMSESLLRTQVDQIQQDPNIGRYLGTVMRNDKWKMSSAPTAN